MAATEQDQQQRTQAIQKAQREPVPFAPRSFDDGWRQAQALARSPLIPKGLKANNLDETTANVMVVLMWGRELGVSPVQSLFNIHVIHGRPAVAAALKVGLVKQAPECLYFQCVESTATQATWETHRKGNAKPTRITYTAEQARRAGLLGRQTRSGEDDNWTKWTETMLRWRAGAMLADAEYPDVTRGLGTSDERPPEDAPSFSAIPETRPVEVVASVALPEPKPQAMLERTQEPERVPAAPEVADPDVTRGQDVPQTAPEPSADPALALEQKAVSILDRLEVEGLSRKELDALTAEANALGAMPPHIKKELREAFQRAEKSLKAQKGA